MTDFNVVLVLRTLIFYQRMSKLRITLFVNRQNFHCRILYGQKSDIVYQFLSEGVQTGFL
jgi:hypothetical protein